LPVVPGRGLAAALQALEEEGQQPGSVLRLPLGGHGDAVGEAEQFGDGEVGADDAGVLGAGEQETTAQARPILGPD
jgi:hypothetical protein